MDGTPLTVVKYRAVGMKHEQAKKWYDDPFHLRVLNTKTIMTELEPDEGCKMAHVMAGTPMILSNRAFIAAWYISTQADGSMIIMSSSKGNEDYYEQHKGLTKKAVVADMIIQYTKITPYDGGMDLVSVS